MFRHVATMPGARFEPDGRPWSRGFQFAHQQLGFARERLARFLERAGPIPDAQEQLARIGELALLRPLHMEMPQPRPASPGRGELLLRLIAIETLHLLV